MTGKHAKVTSIIFVLLIALLSLMSVMGPNRTFSESENRYLAQKPEFSAKALFEGSYTMDYETYITDQFIFRDGFISMKTMSELIMGKKDINGVYFAKDDYLIEVHPESEIDKGLCHRNADRMIQFVNGMKEQEGIRNVSIMIVPTAVVTLEEKLPPFAVTFDQNALIDYIGEDCGDSFVDVRAVLSEHSNEYIYYRTDHHWTTDGAYLAYDRWARQAGFFALPKEAFDVHVVSDEFLGTLYSKVNYAPQADTIVVYEAPDSYRYHVDYNMGQMESDSLYDEEALETKDKYGFFLKGNQAVVDIVTNVENDRRLLIVKDSYAHCFAPFAANHFEEVVMIDMRYLKKPVSQIVEEYGITDILVLYNAIHFAQDTNMGLLQ